MAAFMLMFFGEDQNDTSALIELTKGLTPAGAKINYQQIRRPPILRRDATQAKRKGMAEEIAGIAKPFAKRQRVVCIVHRDCDAIDPAHESNTEELKRDLEAAGVPNPVPATPAWEMEAWWMLFPQALQAVRSCWTQVSYANANTGMFVNAKEKLRRDLRPQSAKCRDYAESDSIAVAREITKQKLATPAVIRRNASLKDYNARLTAALT